MNGKLKAGIVGASGYTGGELLRLLLGHPQIDVVQATSERHVGEYVHSTHPHLRKRTALQFVSRQVLKECDVLFLALPHGEAQKEIGRYAGLAGKIVDLSADFRLKDPAAYKKWYGRDHAAPQWIGKFVYGLPEFHRAEMQTAEYISGVGCNATAANLALAPLVRGGLLDSARTVIVDVKVGSSEGGGSPNAGSHHPERAGVIRTYAPSGHRHTAEVIQELGLPDFHMTITSVDLVRGALAAAHCFAKPGVTEKDLWRAYRAFAKAEPFLRIVKEKTGVHRVPDPKILAGSNYVDLGFELDPDTGRIVSMAAIDNLMKGASGSAVQAMNVMCGFEETLGLEFGGLHPI
ncbi:MAG: N-acetyl-gamma-glutamyl-phosphate reductase [Anaerolineales bacterium]|nr:N-acetyl-gamma-glutamyl-phosphate reductase [Anaerolineales bacterium]